MTLTTPPTHPPGKEQPTPQAKLGVLPRTREFPQTRVPHISILRCAHRAPARPHFLYPRNQARMNGKTRSLLPPKTSSHPGNRVPHPSQPHREGWDPQTPPPPPPKTSKPSNKPSATPSATTASPAPTSG